MEKDSERQFTLITSQLLELIEVLFELVQHKPEHGAYWEGYCDSLCVLLGEAVELEPNLQRPELVEDIRHWLALAQVDEIERRLIEDQGFDC